MRRFASICLSIIVFAVALAADGPDLDRLMKYRNLGSVQVSPGGKFVAFVVTAIDLEENANNSDLWLANPDSGESFQLTRSPKGDSQPRWSPDGKEIAFTSSRNGRPQIFLISPFGGEARQVTKFKKLGVGQFRWLPDGSGFVFTARDPRTPEEDKARKDKRDAIEFQQNLKYSRLYLFKMGEKEPEKLTEGDFHVTGFSVSPDGKSIAFSSAPTPLINDLRSKSDLKLFDLESREIRELVTRPGADGGPVFSPDGKWVAFSSNGGDDAPLADTNLWVVKPDGGGLRNISKNFEEGIGGVRWSPAGDAIYFTASQGVFRRLYRLDVAGGKIEAVNQHDGRAVSGSFDLIGTGGGAAIVLSDAHSPAELYRAGLAQSNLVKLSEINSSFEDTAPATEIIRYPGKDGLEIEALVIKPKDFKEGTRYPLLLVIHGGPAGAFTYSFGPRRGAYPLHAFAEQGYVTLMVNPRGSTGYGKKFRLANVKDWGYGDFNDLMAGVDKLVADGVADPERMGVMGWSYGGYMTSWVVTQTNRFKAASTGASLNNMVSMYGNTDIYPILDGYFGGPPWEETETYWRSSALRFVKNVKTPLLIQHGEQDRRVRISQAEEYYTALKTVGVPVELVIYPRQPHGVREPRLARMAMERNFHWFNKWVLGIEPPKKEKKKGDAKESGME